MKAKHLLVRAVPMAAAGLLVPLSAVQGYGGPGSVITGVGAFLAAVIAVGAALLGFIWYPTKRLLRAFRSESEILVDDEMSRGS